MKKKMLTRTVALLCTGILAAGTVAAAVPKSLTGWSGLSRAAFTWLIREEEAEIGLPMLENALREYFGLDEDEALTTDHLAMVTGIRFELSRVAGNLPEGYEEKTAVKCVINDGVLPGVPAHENDFGYELIPAVVRARYFDTDSITDEMSFNKFRAFYTSKDANDPLLTDRAVAEMQALFPNTIADVLYLLDPTAKPRELRELARIALEYGIANGDTLIDGTAVDLTDADVAQFPNLETVEFAGGLSGANELADVTVMTETVYVPEEEEEETADASGMLMNAIREYLGLDEGDALTDETLAQVKTVRFGLSKFHGNLPEEYNGMTAVKVVINNGFLPGTEERAGMYGDLAYELYPFIARAKYFETDGITEEWDSMKFRSFFIVKDINDPTLEPGDVEDMLTQFPNLQADALVIADPYTKEREMKELANIILEYGIGNTDTLIDGMTIDLTGVDMAVFPNLEGVEFEDGLEGILG